MSPSSRTPRAQNTPRASDYLRGQGHHWCIATPQTCVFITGSHGVDTGTKCLNWFALACFAFFGSIGLLWLYLLVLACSGYVCLFWLYWLVLAISACSGYIGLFWLYLLVLAILACSGYIGLFWLYLLVLAILACSGYIGLFWLYWLVLAKSDNQCWYSTNMLVCHIHNGMLQYTVSWSE